MRVYRGPSSKPFYDDTHEFVSTITSEQLAEGIRSKAMISFNITKDGYERKAVCNAFFDEADIIPMIDALVFRLKKGQEALSQIGATMGSKELSDAQKLAAVKSALAALK